MTHTASSMLTWISIGVVAALAIAGEVLIAGAMQKLGDLDIIRERSGMAGAIRAVLSSPLFLTGAFCMALNFFAMLYTLSLVDFTLAMPACELYLRRQRYRGQNLPAGTCGQAAMAGCRVRLRRGLSDQQVG